jgi:peptidoglycan biosynthesis protein MviN/MurJ (putative lipid II flippase)
VDAYVFVVNLVNWPVSVWFSVLTVVLLPLVARLRYSEPHELPRFRAELLGLTLLIAPGLGLIAWLGLPRLLRADWLGLSGETLAATQHMMGGLAWLAPLGIIVSLFSSWLLAAGRHRNTLFEAIPALTLLIALLLPQGLFPEPLLWGTVVGVALQMMALALPLRWRGELPAPSFGQRSPAWQHFWGSIGIMALGQLMMACTSIIDQFFAARLGPGALSTLSYSNRILSLLLGLGATAISRATLPVFSETHVKGGADVSALALRWTKWVFVLGIAVLLTSWIAAPWGIDLLFRRGAFTAEDGGRVTEVFRYAALQVPPYFAGLVLTSALFSKQRYSTIAIIAISNACIKLILNFELYKTLRLNGLVISSVAMYTVSSLLCLVAVRRLVVER